MLVWMLLWTLNAVAGADFARCEALVKEAPDARLSYRCFYMEARKHGVFDEAARRLSSLSVEAPGELWRELSHGNVLSATGQAEAVEHYEVAIEGFRERGLTQGVVYGELGLKSYYSLKLNREEVERHLVAAEEAAVASGEPMLLATVHAERARFLWHHFHPGEAIAFLEKAEAVAFPSGDYQLKVVILHTAAGVYLEVGRPDLSWSYSQRLVALCHEAGDAFVEATARANMLAMLEDHPELVTGWDEEAALAFALETQQIAKRGGHPYILAASWCEIGSHTPDLERARELLARCHQEAVALDYPETVHGSLRLMGRLELRDDPALAVRLLDEAVAYGESYALRWQNAQVLMLRAEAEWSLGQRAKAMATGEEAMSLVELIQDQMRGEVDRAALTGAWTDVYAHNAARARDAGDLERAWRTTERLRGRLLLESVAEVAQSKGGLTVAAREEVRRLEDRLWDELTPAERVETTAQLRDLVASLPEAVFVPPSLEELQDRLEPGELLLSYQLPLDRRWGAWLLAVSSEGVHTYPLPDRPQLVQKISVFRGLVEQGDTTSIEATSSNLYEALLGPALIDAPGTDRLILLLDGPLYELPFAAIRPVNGPSMSIQPSGTLWAHWRQEGPGEVGPALSFANPPMPDEALPALPQAEAEGRAWARAFGPGSEALHGASASERAMKDRDLHSVRVLHFATHAVTDALRPDQSALMLAAGGGEDGRLRAEEIRGLSLDGQAVILSACRTAGGRVVGGEGPMSLARAFFEAGAHAVVGTLWPLRDEDARRLFEGLAELLGEGQPLQDAVAMVQAREAARGAPAATWAGVVVYGEGSVVLAAPPPPGDPRGLWGAFAGALSLSLVFGLLLYWRRKKREGM